MKNVLLVGFDSAWSRTNKGAISAAFTDSNGNISEVESQKSSTGDAKELIQEWQNKWSPARTVIAVDQPIVVENESGQRPVENVVSSIIGSHLGGVQPSSTSKEVFGEDAPIWDFVEAFGGASDPRKLSADTFLIETYPSLHQIATGYTLSTDNDRMRLPKYNPTNSNFSENDWSHVCSKLSKDLKEAGFLSLAEHASSLAESTSPSKGDQDKVDSYFCLLTAYAVAVGQAMAVGGVESGYMIVPHNEQVLHALRDRCEATGRDPSTFVYAL